MRSNGASDEQRGHGLAEVGIEGQLGQVLATDGQRGQLHVGHEAVWIVVAETSDAVSFSSSLSSTDSPTG